MPTQTPKRIKSINKIIELIEAEFDFRGIDLFFVAKDNGKRTIFTVLRSLPGLKLKQEEKGITIESTWNSRRNNEGVTRLRPDQNSWEEVNNYRNENRSYLAQCFMGIPLVSEIAMFPYGFEIHGKGAVGLYAIRSHDLFDASTIMVQSLVGTDGAKPPGLSDAASVMPLQYFWRDEDRSDDFDEFLAQQKSKPAKADKAVSPSIGQGRKKLLVSEE
jgi:hypothetical protein